jgi:flagellar hook-associated protein 3 FlgL
MRVTHRTLQDQWLQDVQNRLGSMDRLNKQIGSGVRVAKPADDPSGAGRIVRLQEVVARNEQYLKNIEEALLVHQASESALDQIRQQVVRARSLAVEGANAASVAISGGFAALADEVAGIRSGVLQMALGRNEGKFLFSGTMDDTPPFEGQGSPYRGDANFLRVNMGNGQAVAVNVPGDRAFRETLVKGTVVLAGGLDLTASPLRFQVSDGISPAVNVTLAGTYARPQDLVDDLNGQLQSGGLNVAASLGADGTLSLSIADSMGGGEITIEEGSGDLEGVLGTAAGTKNVFAVLDDLEAALRSEDSGAVSRLLDRLDRALDGLADQRGQLGARGRNLEFARDRLQASNVTSETLKSQIEGVDLPRAVTQLSAEEQAYQTALAAGARIFNVSILDFLR